MMTLIAFASVAVAFFLLGGISCVAFATYLEELDENPPVDHIAELEKAEAQNFMPDILYYKD